MLLLLLVVVLLLELQGNRFSFGLQQGRRLRRCLLLLLVEALYQLMLHRNTTQPSTRKTQFVMIYSSLTVQQPFIAYFLGLFSTVLTVHNGDQEKIWAR